MKSRPFVRLSICENFSGENFLSKQFQTENKNGDMEEKLHNFVLLGNFVNLHSNEFPPNTCGKMAK